MIGRPESTQPALALLGPHRRLVKWAIGFSLANELLLVLAATLSAYLVGQAINGTETTELLSGVLVLAAAAPFVVLTAGAASYVAHKMSFDSHHDIRRALFDAFERLSPAYFVRRRSGDATAAASSDVELVELYTAHYLPTRVVGNVVPACAAVALALLHPWLLAALLPFLILLATLPAWLRKRAQDQGQEILDRGAQQSADLLDAVHGLREIAAFGAEEILHERIDHNAQRLGLARVAHGRRGGAEKAIADILVGLGLLSVLTAAALLVDNGALTAAAYPPAVVLAASAFLPLVNVIGLGREMNRVTAAAQRITALLREPATVTEAPGIARVSSPVVPRVVFDRVAFRYTADLPDVLKGVCFTIEPGERVALVGHSGAGKSTCGNLLLRLWDPTAGHITIGGHALTNLPLSQLPELVTHVPQDVYLFNDDVMGNIRVGCTSASDAEVKAAAAVAQAAEFIEGLPHGYHTQLGERGARLSGGQRQRLALAQACLSPAPILVMDEAVSNLDTESEDALHRALTDLGGERTILIIAHRPSTIATANRVVVLSHGAVVDEGRYDDLLKTQGPFANLVRQGLDRLA